MLVEKGVSVKPSSLTLQRVFERIQQRTGRKIVPAMVYERIWANQEEYRWDVLATFIASNNDAEIDTVELAQLFVRDSDRSTRSACERALYEVIRFGAIANAKPKYLLNMRAAAAIARKGFGDASPGRVRVASELAQGLAKQATLYSAMYEWIVGNLGFRMRVPYTFDLFTLIVGAAGDGCEVRSDYDSRYLGTRMISVPPTNSACEWTMFGILVGALTMSNTSQDRSPFPTPPKRWWLNRTVARRSFGEGCYWTCSGTVT